MSRWLPAIIWRVDATKQQFVQRGGSQVREASRSPSDGSSQRPRANCALGPAQEHTRRAFTATQFPQQPLGSLTTETIDRNASATCTLIFISPFPFCLLRE